MTAPLLGLTVRWSLRAAPEGVEQALAAYVEEQSHARFTGQAGLRFKVWRVQPGEWFEGTYVFATEAARAEFQEAFTATAATAPGTRLVGSEPELVEAWGLVAVAEGWDGFEATARA